MAIYLVKDSDRPMWVRADSFGEAVNKWKALVADENAEALTDVDEPRGVEFVCGEEEFLP